MQLPDIDWGEAVRSLSLSALAAFAGMLGYTMRTIEANRKPSVLRSIFEGLCSGLIGYLVVLIGTEFALGPNYTGIACGMLGWMGAPASIRFFEKILNRKFGLPEEPTDGAGKS